VVRVALIRGINVGRAKRIAMADLRAVVAGLGCRNVRTLLNSGNVVFDDPDAGMKDPAGRIEKAIGARLGIAARVTVLSAAEVAAAVARNPFGGDAGNPSRLLLAVPRDPADMKRLKPLARSDWSPGAFALGVRVAYLWCPEGVIASRLAREIERLLGDGVTSRNWATMTKLDALARAAGPQ